ncbi:MAG: GNAT family N-acetyltransferase [Anaerolineae bacterium]|nr:GNAT family N-acetyltransferase [Anaerolineae bacterium]
MTTMTNSIRIERVPNGQVSEHDDAVLERISAESFTQPWVPPVSQWAETEQHFFARDEQGEIVSSLGVVRRTVIVGGTHQVNVGGIGGVMTAVAARRRGYAGALMRAAADCFRDEWKLPFGLIQTADRNLKFYQELGWWHAPCRCGSISPVASVVPRPKRDGVDVKRRGLAGGRD